jgi:hypothetical protein
LTATTLADDDAGTASRASVVDGEEGDPFHLTSPLSPLALAVLFVLPTFTSMKLT